MNQSLLEKAKLVAVRLDKILIMVPFTVSRIEVRVRALLLNQRPLLDGISHFM